MWPLLVLAALGAISPLMANEAPDRIEGAMTVDLVQAAHLHHRGALFIDVRADDKWRWGHIAGAVHLNYDSDFGELERTEIPRDLPLVIYCDSDLCEDAPAAVQLAVEWGYRQVFYFREGFFGWQLADLPQEQGASPQAIPLSARAP